MSLQLIVLPDAEGDIAEGHDWYERHRKGLGVEFVEEVSATIDAVHSRPLQFPIIFGELRRALVHRFPYGVFFVVHTDRIVVIAALHLARHPRLIQKRIQNH